MSFSLNKADVYTIILCGGKISPSNLPIGTNISNATLPVNGKPVIAWILDDLMQKGFTSNIIVVVRHEDKKLQKLLSRIYAKKMKVTYITVTEPSCILESLQAGLSAVKDHKPVQVLLGDTLIRDNFDCMQDMVYIGEVRDAKRWCLALIDDQQRLVKLIDKEEDRNLSYNALAGYYFFSDGALIKSVVEQSLAMNNSELSSAIQLYLQHRPIYAHHANEWYDFGHIDNLLDSKRNLLRPRYFNQLHVNPVLNTITKISQDSEKLRNELDWYVNLPDDLKVLTPRILHRKKKDAHVEITQEYYGYPTLAELYVYSDLHPENWRIILRHLLKIHEELRRYSADMPTHVLSEMYIQKTDERLLALTQKSEFWNEVLNRPEIIYNEKSYQNYYELKPFIEHMVDEMKQDFMPTIIHGDFCFSNILYDPSNQIVRLIDPRGSFGSIKGIYGDPRYDMAKLRHSIAGMYDFIVADMFEVKINGETFSGEIFDMQNLSLIIENFDNQLEKANYNLQHIKLIEGLLFVSMLPLHHDYPQRQIMMFLTGIIRLNEVKSEYDTLVSKSKHTASL